MFALGFVSQVFAVVSVWKKGPQDNSPGEGTRGQDHTINTVRIYSQKKKKKLLEYKYSCEICFMKQPTNAIFGYSGC